MALPTRAKGVNCALRSSYGPTLPVRGLAKVPIRVYRADLSIPALRTVTESQLSEDEGTPVTERVFTFKRWAAHRNTNERYLRHMKGMLKSVTWRNLTPPLTSITLLATAVCAYETARAQGTLAGWPSLQLSDGPLQLTSFALSLLLVFRTDSSYSRWQEAMGVWNRVRNTSKDIVRDAASWVRDPALLSAIVRWTLAYAYSLKAYLREGSSISATTYRLLLKHEHTLFCELCKDTTSAYPQYALQVLTQAVGRAGISANREDKLLAGIGVLNACVGSCEAIQRYPIPLSYTRHTSRFMIIWLAFLPLALYDEAGWATVPITCLVSFLLLGIEEIGVQIEEPFSLLPLRDLVKDIERDLWAIAESRKEVGTLLDLSLSLSNGDTLKQMSALAKVDLADLSSSSDSDGSVSPRDRFSKAMASGGSSDDNECPDGQDDCVATLEPAANEGGSSDPRGDIVAVAAKAAACAQLPAPTPPQPAAATVGPIAENVLFESLDEIPTRPQPVPAPAPAPPKRGR